eukprot:TRINITY_DN12954_c0_g1_i2.p1 TRINITY_DN12954_c0_g1~~TRINITY_DN12954_c0_g1_i2.p1  ORF type:complete len:331 (+),score=22.50 TRINITY_DN12954_c0_g1_i2:49-1041(+)
MSINCTLDPEGCESQRLLFTILISLLGTLSFLGSISIMITVFWFKLYGKLKHRLILYLSLADVCQSLATVISYVWSSTTPEATNPLCFIQGFLFNFSNVTSSLWNANTCLFVTLFIISTATIGTTNLPGTKYEIFSVVVWILGIFLSAYGPIALVTEEKPYFYGPISNGVYCWVTEDFPVERITFHYLWMFISLGSMILLTTINLVYLCTKNFGARIDNKINGLIITLVGYPIIYAIVFMPLAISRVLTGLGVRVPVEFILVGVCILVSNGLLNALYYGISRNLYQKWRLELSGKTVRGKNSTSKSTDRSKSRKRSTSGIDSNDEDNRES